MDRLTQSRHAVHQRLERACAAAGRQPAEVALVAVTKSVEPELAGALFDLGERDLGESRAAELERKHAWFAARGGPRPRWHFIGHLQRNKARRVARLAHFIHSVDSLRLLETLARLGEEDEGARPGLFLQVKLTDEAAKHGLAPEELEPALELARAPRAPHGSHLRRVPLVGLMTMGPLVEGTGDASARGVFARLRRLAEGLPGEAFEGGAPRLSMGMSGDLEDAVAEGAHVVRVGSAFFEGAREPAERGEGGG